MRIVMVNSVSFLPTQGRYRWVYAQAKSLVDAGHEVHILAWDRLLEAPEREVIDGIHVERIRVKAGFGRLTPIRTAFRLLWFHIRLLVRLLGIHADVFHTFNPDVIPPVALVARLTRKPHVMALIEPHYYYNWPDRYRPLIKLLDGAERHFALRASAVVVHNLYQVNKFTQMGVRNVVHLAQVPDRALADAELPDRSKRTGTVVFGRIGTVFGGINGIEELIPAFKAVLDTGHDAKLVIAGRVSPEFEEEFKKLVAPLGDKLVVTGSFHPNEIAKQYEGVDVSIQLTPRTIFYRYITPTKFTDSLAHGVPVISSAIGDVPYLAEKTGAAILVDETNVESIRDGMTRLIEDRELRLRMGKAGLDLVRNEYCWDQMQHRLFALYDSLDSKARAAHAA